MEKNNQVHTLTPGESLDAWTMRGNLKQPNSKRETHNSRSHWVAAWNAQGEILHPEIAVYQEKLFVRLNQVKKINIIIGILITSQENRK